MGSVCQRITCQTEYLRSASGILKIIELLCDLLAVILCGAAPTLPDKGGNKGFFLFVSILALIVTTVIFILAMLNIRKFCIPRAWPFIEICWCLFIGLFYFIASIVIATIASMNGAYGGAAFFGFAAFLTYIADAINEFRLTRNANSQASAHATQYAPDNNRPPTY